MIYRHYLSVTSDKNIRETITEIATENSLKFVIKSSQVNGQSQQASFFTLEGSTPRDIWRNADGLQEYLVSHCFTTTDLGYDEEDHSFILRGLGLRDPRQTDLTSFLTGTMVHR